MTASKTLLIASLFLGLCSLVYLIKGSATSTPATIAKLSETKWGSSDEILRSLSQQRADSIVGFSLLLITFTVQTISALLPDRITSAALNTRGVLIAAVIALAIAALSLPINRKLYNDTYSAAKVLVQR